MGITASELFLSQVALDETLALCFFSSKWLTILEREHLKQTVQGADYGGQDQQIRIGLNQHAFDFIQFTGASAHHLRLSLHASVHGCIELQFHVAERIVVDPERQLPFYNEPQPWIE